jgi:hypothetical protein
VVARDAGQGPWSRHGPRALTSRGAENGDGQAERYRSLQGGVAPSEIKRYMPPRGDGQLWRDNTEGARTEFLMRLDISQHKAHSTYKIIESLNL